MNIQAYSQDDMERIARDNGFSNADIIYYYGVLDSYTEPRNIDEFISHLKTVGGMVNQFRSGTGAMFNRVSQLIQLYADGYLYPFISPARLIEIRGVTRAFGRTFECILYDEYRLPDVLAIEKLMKNGVALLNFKLDCPTIAKYISEINTYRYRYKSSAPDSEFYSLLYECKKYFKFYGYSTANLPNDWGNFTVLPMTRNTEFGDPLWGRVYALKMHFVTCLPSCEYWKYNGPCPTNHPYMQFV